MRKIIQGKLYSTDTATHVATDSYTRKTGDEDDKEVDVTECLYRTPGGAFFVVMLTDGPDRDEDGDLIRRDSWTPRSREQAERWFNTGVAIELHEESVFAMPDEATAEDDQERTISMTVRVPSSLRDQLSRAAAKESISMNAYMVRCAKRCLEGH
jgi:predicted HicB family RNase H-like nuclease